MAQRFLKGTSGVPEQAGHEPSTALQMPQVRPFLAGRLELTGQADVLALAVRPLMQLLPRKSHAGVSGRSFGELLNEPPKIEANEGVFIFPFAYVFDMVHLNPEGFAIRRLHEMTCRVMRRAEVAMTVGLARSTIYALMAKGGFPKPVKLGERAVAWREADIEHWLGDARSLDRKPTQQKPSNFIWLRHVPPRTADTLTSPAVARYRIWMEPSVFDRRMICRPLGGREWLCSRPKLGGFESGDQIQRVRRA